jgi:hypothetical protein
VRLRLARDSRGFTAPATTPPTIAFNVLTHAGAQVRDESAPCRPSDTAWESYPVVVSSTLPVRPSPPLYGTLQQGQRQLHDTVLPTLIRPARRTLERGRRNPQKRDRRLSHARPGRHRDVGPVRRVSSVTISPVRPSLLPRCHPGHCSAIPDVVGIQDDKTLPCLLLCALRPPVSRTLESAYRRRPNGKSPHGHPRSRSWTDTGRVVTLCQKQDSPGRPPTPRRCTPYRHT